MRAANSRIRAFGLAMLVFHLACGVKENPRPSAEPPDRALFVADSYQFPGETWTEVEDPGEWGWSSAQLAEARADFERLDSAAVMIVHRGVLIASWGEVATRYNGASLRKAFLGGLVGQEVAAGRLDIESTLAELGIDDSSNPLTPIERRARVADLLQSRAAVYLPAIHEAPSWKRFRPERGAHAPGESWFYSNWGFNALGTIFERSSGVSIPRAFAERIAEPIGMEDFRVEDVHYLERGDLSERLQDNDSEHPAAIFMISARDCARFGLLYLAGGRWGDRQVVPADWVERIPRASVETHPALRGDRYGYLWWVSPAESALGLAIGHASIKATGGRGEKIVVVPELDLVVVHRLAGGGVSLASQLRRRFLGAPSVDAEQFNELMRKIVAAHPAG